MPMYIKGSFCTYVEIPFLANECWHSSRSWETIFGIVGRLPLFFKFNLGKFFVVHFSLDTSPAISNLCKVVVALFFVKSRGHFFISLLGAKCVPLVWSWPPVAISYTVPLRSAKVKSVFTPRGERRGECSPLGDMLTSKFHLLPLGSNFTPGGKLML
jgi:hypothetical protein